MVNEKNPSIYSDRSTIGSSNELDEYGVWVKSEPQDLSSVGSETLPDIEDLPDFDMEEMETMAGTESFEFTDIPAEEPAAEEDAGPGGESSFNESDFTEVSLNDFLSDSEGFGEPEAVSDVEFDNIESLSGEGPETAGSFDEGLDFNAEPETADLPSFDPQPEEPQSAAGAVAASSPAPAPAADLSTQLLMRIAEELSSIKKELSGLKTELSVVRGEAAAEAGGKQEGGFFDEEDDEKIALTGDELNNILNTADFTEEAGSDATEALSDDFTLPGTDSESDSLLLDQPGLLADEDQMEMAGGGETAQEPSSILDNDVFNVTLDADSLGDDTPPEDESPAQAELPEEEGEGPEEIILDLSEDFTNLEDKDTDELKQLREEGAPPMTEAPVDTSYLDEDPLAHEEIDLSGAVIDEPDLGEIKEMPLEEPSLDDISLDLDMEEELPPPGETAEEPAEEPSMEVAGDLDMPGGFAVESGDTGLEEPPPAAAKDVAGIPVNLKQELKTVLTYMDQLLESLPEDKIEEFAKSEYFDTYKKLFEELGLV